MDTLGHRRLEHRGDGGPRTGRFVHGWRERYPEQRNPRGFRLRFEQFAPHPVDGHPIDFAVERRYQPGYLLSAPSQFHAGPQAESLPELHQSQHGIGSPGAPHASPSQ